MPRPLLVLSLLWACFLVRAVWHAVFLPLWEGFDEWAHMASIQHYACAKRPPVLGISRISDEIQASLALVPLAPVPLSTPHLTHDQYWRLPPERRRELQIRLDHVSPQGACSSSPTNELNYQAQHPPAYYLLLAPVEKALRHVPLPRRVLWLRFVNALLVSLLIPLGYFVARQLSASAAMGLATACLLATMPLNTMTAARLTNDSLAALLTACLLLAAVLLGPARSLRSALACGLLLAAGLLTKVYFVTAVAALAVLFLWRSLAEPRLRLFRLKQLATIVTVSALGSGWWYVRNWQLTGSWSGMQQVVAVPPVDLRDTLWSLTRVNWPEFAETVFNTHIWVGHWSFLLVRSWIYDVFALLYTAAALGLLAPLLLRQPRRPRIDPFLFAFALALCLAFSAGLLYHELTFQRLGLSSSAGWYTVAIAVPLATLLALGWTSWPPARFHGWPLALAVSCFVLLELYTMNFLLLPYYTGLISHLADGRLASMHLSEFARGGLLAVLERSGRGLLSPRTSGLLWGLAVAGGLLPAGLAWRLVRKRALS